VTCRAAHHHQQLARNLYPEEIRPDRQRDAQGETITALKIEGARRLKFWNLPQHGAISQRIWHRMAAQTYFNSPPTGWMCWRAPQRSGMLQSAWPGAQPQTLAAASRPGAAQTNEPASSTRLGWA
jgi:hypothetical protein